MRTSETRSVSPFLWKQIWYNRHRIWRARFESGEIKIIPRDQHAEGDLHRPEGFVSDVWESALAAASATEDEVGPEHLGPWSDFERGMLNGKLSTLRWVLGDEWDMRDT